MSMLEMSHTRPEKLTGIKKGYFLFLGPNMSWASQVAQRKRIGLLTQKVQIRSLGQEDPLEREVATHPSILAENVPLTKEPGGLQFMKPQRVRYD